MFKFNAFYRCSFVASCVYIYNIVDMIFNIAEIKIGMMLNGFFFNFTCYRFCSNSVHDKK